MTHEFKGAVMELGAGPRRLTGLFPIDPWSTCERRDTRWIDLVKVLNPFRQWTNASMRYARLFEIMHTSAKAVVSEQMLLDPSVPDDIDKHYVVSEDQNKMR